MVVDLIHNISVHNHDECVRAWYMIRN